MIVTMAVIVVGFLALVRATMGAKTDHASARVGRGEAEPRTLRTFHEVPDIGAHWTVVAAYGGREVYRETLARVELAARNWTITIPADASDALGQADFQ